MASELAVGYVTLVPSAKGIVAGLEKEMTGPLVLAGRTSGAKASSSFGAAFKSGLKTAAIGVGVIAGIAAVGKSFDDAFNTIERGTGATGETLKSLDASFKNVLKGGSGSFDQVSAAITKLNQRTGLTGKALEDFASKQVTLARITKTDVNANLEASTSLFNLYGIATLQQSKKLDVLFRASQVAGVSITQLADDMKSAAPTAKILGLTIDQTAAIVANLDRAGLPASKVMLGLASSFAKAAKAGKDPLTVIHDLVAEIKAAPDATTAATIAVQKFGIGARQAATLVAGIRSGAIDLDKTLADGKGIKETAAATATLSGKLAHLKNVALVGLEPLATQTLGAVTRAVTLAIPAVEALSAHMDILGPIIIGAATAFIAFKVAVGISNTVKATTTALTSMKAAILGTSAAQTAATALAASAAAAKTAEAAAATAAAGALTLEADAALAAATAGGAVDISAFTAATALQAQAVAATEAAAAMTAEAVATEEAVVASRAFALTPIGAIAIAAAAAVTILTVKTKLFSKGQKDAGRATNDFIGSLLQEGKALKDVAGQVLVKAIGDNHKLADAYHDLGVPLSTVTAALSGNKDALHTVLDAERDKLRSGDLTLSQAIKINDSISKTSKSLHDQQRDYKNATTATKELSAAQGESVDSAQKAAQAQDQLRVAATQLTTAIINNADRLRGLQSGLVGVFQQAINLKQGLVDIAEKQKVYNAFVHFGTQNTKEGVKALQELQLARLGQIASTDSAVDSVVKIADETSHLTDELKKQTDAQAGLDKAQSDFASGKGSPAAVAAAQATLNKATEDVTGAQKKYRDQILAVAAFTSGPLHDALLVYAGQIANLPPSKPTKIETPGLDSAKVRMHDYRGEISHLPEAKATRISLDADQALSTLARLKARIASLPSNVPISAVVRAEGGRLAKGGRAEPGREYLVGERGTELLRMYASGAYVFSHSHSETQRAMRLPELADGGVFRNRTVAVIGEDARTTPEIVSPVTLMAETFRRVLKETLSTTVIKTEAATSTVSLSSTSSRATSDLASSTTFSADTTAALKQVQGYLAELAKVPAQVVSKVVVDTAPAVVGFTRLVQAVSVSAEPFEAVSTRLRDISTETRLSEVRVRESERSIRDVAKTSSDLTSVLNVQHRSAESTRSTQVDERRSVSESTVKAVVRVADETLSRIITVAKQFVPAEVARPRTVTPSPPQAPAFTTSEMRRSEVIRTQVSESSTALVNQFKTATVSVDRATTTFVKSLERLPDTVVNIKQQTERVRAVRPAAAERSDSGQFDFAFTHAPTAPIVSPAAQLTAEFKTQLQRAGDSRSIVGVQHQEIHVDRPSVVEEINVANRKLGMRVALAGLR